MKLRLSSTSYLLPSYPIWKTINYITDIKFGDYGDWLQSLTINPQEDALCLVIFLEDLISKEILFSEVEEDISKAESVIDSAIEAIKFRLNNHPENYTFIAWFGWHPDNIIRFARKKTLLIRIGEYFSKTIFELSNKYNRLFLIPLDIIFGEEGFKNCIDSRNFFLFRSRLSQNGTKLLATSLNNIISRINIPSCKLLVLDCDNTLWGGVIGENGIGGIKIGQDGVGNAFSTFQYGVKQLAKNGLLLAISSKNEEKDVTNVLENHSSMILKKEDFILKKVDWRDKSIHIKEIADEIGIGLNSIVFWDDNPIEREKVKLSLPDVIVVDPPEEVVDWYDKIRELHYFATFCTTEEDNKKLSQYRAKTAFEENTKLFNNYNDFLINTIMEPSIIEINNTTIARAVQLLQKTNQLNLRLIRHDELILTTLLENSENIGFLIHLRDKFGDHGVIALVITNSIEYPKKAFLDTFLMSCRVLGRNLEGWIFEQLRIKLLQKGYQNLEAEYVYGPRNSPAKELLTKYNFTYTGSDETNNLKKDKYTVELNSWSIPDLNIFKK
jgi:FkbH-like protein